MVHRRTADADVYLVINTGPSVRSTHAHAAGGPWLVRGMGCPYREVVRAGRLHAGVDLRLHPYQATVIVLSDQEPVPPARGS